MFVNGLCDLSNYGFVRVLTLSYPTAWVMYKFYDRIRFGDVSTHETRMNTWCLDRAKGLRTDNCNDFGESNWETVYCASGSTPSPSITPSASTPTPSGAGVYQYDIVTHTTHASSDGACASMNLPDDTIYMATSSPIIGYYAYSDAALSFPFQGDQRWYYTKSNTIEYAVQIMIDGYINDVVNCSTTLPTPSPTISLSKTPFPSRSITPTPSPTISFSRTPSTTPTKAIVAVTNNASIPLIENVMVNDGPISSSGFPLSYLDTLTGTTSNLGSQNIDVYISYWDGGSNYIKFIDKYITHYSSLVGSSPYGEITHTLSSVYISLSRRLYFRWKMEHHLVLHQVSQELLHQVK